jgi:hypothetical protein
MLQNNKATLQQIQCSNIPHAVTNNIMDLVAWTPNLTFLDISYAKTLTDDGLHHFKDRILPIKKLFINGLTGITSTGVIEMLSSCQSSLKILEAALMD